jgi:hypothetical protein
VAPSCRHCFHGNVTLVSFIVDLYVSVNNIEVFCVAVEMLELVLFSLLSSFKIFPTAVNNINVRRSSCMYPYLCGHMIPRAMLALAYATGRASHARQVKGDVADKKGYPGPPGWGFGVGLTTPHSKKLLLRKSNKGEAGWI